MTGIQATADELGNQHSAEYMNCSVFLLNPLRLRTEQNEGFSGTQRKEKLNGLQPRKLQLANSVVMTRRMSAEFTRSRASFYGSSVAGS